MNPAVTTVAGAAAHRLRHGPRQRVIDVLIVTPAGFFNPMLRSPRPVEARLDRTWLPDLTGVGRSPTSTLGDTPARFDPGQVRPLVNESVARGPAPGRRDADSAQVARRIVVAEGSYFRAAGEVAWAMLPLVARAVLR